MADLKSFYTSDNFDWALIGDIGTGRKNLGDTMPVAVYRLMQYSIRDTLKNALGKEQTIELFRTSGRTAGIHFTRNLLDTNQDFPSFISQLRDLLKDMKIGILRIESVSERNEIILTMSEDLDCSGLPVLGETVCNYDEGFLEGVLGGVYREEIYRCRGGLLGKRGQGLQISCKRRRIA